MVCLFFSPRFTAQYIIPQKIDKWFTPTEAAFIVSRVREKNILEWWPWLRKLPGIYPARGTPFTPTHLGGGCTLDGLPTRNWMAGWPCLKMLLTHGRCLQSSNFSAVQFGVAQAVVLHHLHHHAKWLWTLAMWLHAAKQEEIPDIHVSLFWLGVYTRYINILKHG